jgi:hypothetical protein
LDEPFEPINTADSAMVRTPTVRKCQRSRIEQQWDISKVDWLPDSKEKMAKNDVSQH